MDMFIYFHISISLIKYTISAFNAFSFTVFISLIDLWHDFGTAGTIYEPGCPNRTWPVDLIAVLWTQRNNFDDHIKNLLQPNLCITWWWKHTSRNSDTLPVKIKVICGVVFDGFSTRHRGFYYDEAPLGDWLLTFRDDKFFLSFEVGMSKKNR